MFLTVVLLLKTQREKEKGRKEVYVKSFFQTHLKLDRCTTKTTQGVDRFTFPPLLGMCNIYDFSPMFFGRPSDWSSFVHPTTSCFSCSLPFLFLYHQHFYVTHIPCLLLTPQGAKKRRVATITFSSNAPYIHFFRLGITK